MKKPYEKPFIARHQTGVINKFGGASFARPTDEIDGVKVSALVAEHGSPLFVYSEATIKRKHAELMDAFSLRYPRVQHAWSYKTNYLKAICKCFHQLGSWAEVVSPMEYEMARRMGNDPAHIIFNGPSKPYGALKTALSEGAIVNIDNMEEIYEIEKIATELGKTVSCGVRLNMSLGEYVSWDRFGLNLDAGHAYQAVKRAVAGGKIKITGLHTHIGTFILDPELYRIAVKKVVDFARLIKKDFGGPASAGIQIQTINMGGGFASKVKLKGTYLAADSVPRFDRYAEAICDELLSAFPSQELPLLILESGRAMIDEAGSLIATVVATKRLGNGTRSLVMDAGVNLLFTSFWYDLEMTPVVGRGSALEDHLVYGPLCMQIDVIMPTIKLPYLEKGDQVVIRPVGAYNNTQWMQFIQYRPNVVMIGTNGKVSVIRKAEDLDYLQALEQNPE
jgi:diaminopimelate decarboxylase